MSKNINKPPNFPQKLANELLATGLVSSEQLAEVWNTYFSYLRNGIFFSSLAIISRKVDPTVFDRNIGKKSDFAIQ